MPFCAKAFGLLEPCRSQSPYLKSTASESLIAKPNSVKVGIMSSNLCHSSKQTSTYAIRDGIECQPLTLSLSQQKRSKACTKTYSTKSFKRAYIRCRRHHNQNLFMDKENLLSELLERINHPNISELDRRKTLNRLLLHVTRLPGLARSPHPDYAVAFNRTLEWFCEHLHEFKPRYVSLEKSLVVWINGYLRWRIKDLYHQDWRTLKKQVSIDTPISQSADNPVTYMDRLSDPKASLNNLDAIIEALQIHENRERACSFQKYVEEDPEELLRQCHLRRAPHCNCHVLATRLLLKEPPDSFASLARELDINYQTLVSHWNKKCLPLLHKLYQERWGDSEAIA